MKLMEIVRTNKNLERQEQNGAPQHVILEFTELLQYHIMTFMDNTVAGMPRALTRSGRSIKSISERLKGRAGRIRGNLMGKRVDFSARTVITPDPNLMLDELGVPWSIALNMTYPETVTPYNIERLQQLVDNGPHPPPGETGARYIIREDGQRLDLRFLKKSRSEKRLEYGYKVERHVVNGDVVLFNRQPSLHKMSIMGHRVRIMPYSTFRLNLSVTPPYNRFRWQTRYGTASPTVLRDQGGSQELMMVPKMIVSPQANKPVMAIMQDTLLGCRLITKRDTFITKGVFMNIIMWLEDWDDEVKPAILKPQPLWTGKQVFSMMLPKVNLKRTSAWAKDADDHDFSVKDAVRIEQGELVTGTLCKKTMGSGGGGLIHVTWEEWGPIAARGLISQTQTLVNYWLLHGFTVGIAHV